MTRAWYHVTLALPYHLVLPSTSLLPRAQPYQYIVLNQCLADVDHGNTALPVPRLCYPRCTVHSAPKPPSQDWLHVLFTTTSQTHPLCYWSSRDGEPEAMTRHAEPAGQANHSGPPPSRLPFRALDQCASDSAPIPHVVHITAPANSPPHAPRHRRPSPAPVRRAAMLIDLFPHRFHEISTE